MPEERKPENEQVDQELADYTDKVIQDGQAPDNDPAGLGRTVEQLWAMSKDSTPSQQTKARIHAAIEDEWQKTYGEEKPSVWQQIVTFFVPPETEWRSRRQTQRAALSRTAVAVVMALVVGFVFTGGGDTSTAAAGSGDSLPWIISGVVVVSGFLWLWITRND